MAVFSLIGSVVGALGTGIKGLASAAGIGGAASSATGGGSLLSGLSTAAGLIGTGVQTVGAMRQASAQKRMEALRQRQMNLEAARAQRATIRQAVIARAQALSTGVSQGASGSSGVLGGMSQVVNQAGQNIQGIRQGQEIGNEMFAANRMLSSAQTLSSIGGTFQQVGSMMAQNYEPNRRVFGWA